MIRTSNSKTASHVHYKDSPIIGRNLFSPASSAANTCTSNSTTVPALPALSISTTSAWARICSSVPLVLATSLAPLRKPTPSLLHTSTAVSPPTSATPYQTNFHSNIHEVTPASPVTQILDLPLRNTPSPEENWKDLGASVNNHRNEDPSPPATPEFRLTGSRFAPVSPNDTTRSDFDPIVIARPLVGSSATNMPVMAGGPSSVRVEATKGAPREASSDSAKSTTLAKTTPDALAIAKDVANLVKAAGSPEAVIQYLLKEKQSQSQQNAQLWRLVDKQRAMILGLNKDLERSLKDKDRYRKKIKEIMFAHDERSKHDTKQATATIVPRVDVNGPKEQAVIVPASPSNHDSDSVKNSPDMSMAPYPITPPADHLINGPLSAVGELLHPSHPTPEPSQHALDNFDHEEEDRAALEAIKVTQASSLDLLFSASLPPSRSLPSEPPRVPPPKPPGSPTLESMSQFPPPSAPPPRKPPPAPLQLRKEANMAAILPPEDENDSDSDFDSLLEVDEIPLTDKRGRRRTREEDEREREMSALQEEERRSISKKSKRGSQKGTPKETDLDSATTGASASPPATVAQPPALSRDSIPSLAGVLGGDDQERTMLSAPLMSPGLPATPRPTGLKSTTLAPLSPRVMGMPTGPLSPRAPRQPIPLPSNSPKSNSPPMEPLDLESPIPLDIVKRVAEPAELSPQERRDSPAERNRIFRGFTTEEYSDLLLPPSALPSIEVRVASSRMKPSRASLISFTQLEEDPVFTLAIYSRAEGGELWRVEKDSASLAKLDQRLKQCASFVAKTPDRSLFSGHAPAKLDARRIVLDQYLDEVFNTPLDMTIALELCKYISTNTLPPYADETGSVVETGAETSVQKTSAGGRPFKSGYLTKRGKNFGGWKARFFVLEGPQLKYYETPGGAHLGTIKLQNAQIGKQSQHTGDGSPATGPSDELDNQYRHAFLVLEPKKKDSSSHVKHVLCAESDRERDQWVEALLRWIDYREPEDEDSHGNTAHDRQGSGNGHVNVLNAKKKMYGQAKPPTARANSEDALIGIKYESSKPGDTPDGAPTRRKNIGTPEPQQQLERAAPPSHAISTPRDAQVLADSASWSGKIGLFPAGPSLEEKKQRKRSFFGFGPKVRSSSDDPDSLFGASASHGNEYRGAMRQVFGAPLAEAVRLNGPVDVSVPLPAVVYRCIQYLDAKNAVSEEGIFRLSGSNVVIKQLRERFNIESDVNLITDETYYDIHAVASLLKLYLRELPTTILTRDLHLQFLAVTEMPSHPEKIAALSDLVQLLPQANGTLLRYLIAFLIKIINNADTNKMTIRNVGIVFSPTLNIPAPVFALLLQNYEGIFRIDPEEYELPSPNSDSDSRVLPELQPRRPSTAGTADSPHRPRMMDQQRMPPTPPPARQVSYEPQNLAQYNGSQTSLRPAYESGGYDRPQYQSSYEQGYGDGPAVSDQPYSNKSNRRESSMFIGNMMLIQQGSKSRLRDDGRM